MKAPRKRRMGIALLGLGTVGQGVWKHILSNRAALERRLGASIELVRAGVRDPAKPRGIEIDAGQMTDDLDAIVDDPQVDIVCELIGGTTRALELTRRALNNGKVVVTANKALICEHGEDLFRTARRSGGHYFFEASVGGGIPIIKVLREGLVANRFPLIYGILNGTSNYILSRMGRDGEGFEEVLTDARALGYVEADESLDLDGWDAAHKAVILAYLAHGKWVRLPEMIVEGIREITSEDMDVAARLGFRIKLLGIIQRDFESASIAVRVHPALIPENETVATIDFENNCVSVSGDVVGTTVLIGRGAGQDATASSVISDVADAVAALLGAPPPIISEEDEAVYQSLAEEVRVAGPADIRSRYYVRLTVTDAPGVLAQVAQVLAEEAISIATVNQFPGRTAGRARLILTTHTAGEDALGRATVRLAALESAIAKPVVIRIFEPFVK